jgi:hypothetical protein
MLAEQDAAHVTSLCTLVLWAPKGPIGRRRCVLEIFSHRTVTGFWLPERPSAGERASFVEGSKSLWYSESPAPDL